MTSFILVLYSREVFIRTRLGNGLTKGSPQLSIHVCVHWWHQSPFETTVFLPTYDGGVRSISLTLDCALFPSRFPGKSYLKSIHDSMYQSTLMRFYQSPTQRLRK
jgi:hypothetical protein